MLTRYSALWSFKGNFLSDLHTHTHTVSYVMWAWRRLCYRKWRCDVMWMDFLFSWREANKWKSIKNWKTVFLMWNSIFPPLFFCGWMLIVFRFLWVLNFKMRKFVMRKKLNFFVMENLKFKKLSKKMIKKFKLWWKFN